MMMDCKSARESLGSWLDGELRGPEAETLQAHVEACPNCAEQRRQTEKLQTLLKGVLAAEASHLVFEPFWQSVEKRITERRAWPAAVMDFVHSAFAGPRLAWAIPAVIVALLGALSVDWLMPGWRAGLQRNSFAAVESIDSYGRNVAVLRENETKTTVIWLYQTPEGENESSSETTGPSSPAF